MSRTLFVGHSLVGQVMPTMFNNFTASQGIDMHADAQVINGAPLRYNWDNGASAEGVNARDVLWSGDYDAVVITEAIPLDDQIRENDTYGYAERYFDLAQNANPDTQFYVYETWHDMWEDTDAWRAQIADDLPTWQGIVNHVNNTAPDGAPEAFMIPAGQAMARLHDRIEAGDVPGVNSIRELFSDHIHLNDTGSWFIAALHASAVTGVDPSTLPLETTNIWGTPFGGPDAALADVMADVIDSTLNDFLPDNAVPPTDGGVDPDPIEEPDPIEQPDPIQQPDPIPQPDPIVQPGEDTFEGTPRNDQIFGTWYDNLIAGRGGDDTLHGRYGDDTLFGGDGNDMLTGGWGNDEIRGGDGNDTFMLGEGSDTVNGGDGDDVFVLTGAPGSVLITDFGANSAQDMIDLSAIRGYDSFADVAETASFSGADTVLTFAVPDGVLSVTVQSDAPLTSADFGLPAEPGGPWEIVPTVEPVDPVDPVDPWGVTYALEGADSHHFTVDPGTGEIGNQSWFDPSYDQIWDINGDRVYEVERVGSNADGQEVSRTFFEMETTWNGVEWREVGDPDDNAADAVDPTGPIEPGTSFYLDGPDAYHFVINSESGEVDNASWFDPNYDQIWDTNGDRIYESERVALDRDGAEISREALEMETTPDGVAWRVVPSWENAEVSGAEIMRSLALPPAEEKDVPSEPEENAEDVILPV